MSSCLLKDGEADFRTFVHHWNDWEMRRTPHLHSHIANWLEMKWKKKQTRLLLMAFRGSGKSTLAALFTAWLLYAKPDLRILVLSADHALARKMVRQVKKIIERHPLTDFLRPDKPDQWASDRFTVKRYVELRDPSVLARGITSNITGSRADVIICDDVEVPKTCDSPEKREDLRARLEEMNFVLTPGGSVLYIGTPHTYFSIYAREPRRERGEEKIFLDKFKRLEIPLLDQSGNSVWPEKFTPYEIDMIRAQSGPNKFASQMMLKPVNIADGRLDPSLLQAYDDDLFYAKELQTLFLGDKKIAAASAWWDPAFGSIKGDNSVLAVMFTGENGDYYLHRVEYIKNASDAGDAATYQCRRIAQIAKELYLPSLTVESNGIGKFLPGLLKNEIALAKTPCAVIEFNNNRPKDLRILEAFDAPLAARRIHVHASVFQTPLLTEMAEWRPGVPGASDDGLDAVAGALAQAPVRLKRHYAQGAHKWARGRKHHKARTEFQI